MVMKRPDWFDWPHWDSAILSNDRYTPRWYERRAYIMGLRDAARIAANVEYIKTPTSRYVRRAGVRPVIMAVHAYVRTFLGLPSDLSRHGIE